MTRNGVKKALLHAPVGSRFGVYLRWKNGNSSHVFIAEKTEQGIMCIDPQNGDTDVSRYFKDGKFFPFGLFRFDDKVITDDFEMLDYAVRRRLQND